MDQRLTTAIIIDDHPVLREGVRSICANADPPIRVLDGGSGLASAWTGPGAEADVIILDLELSPAGPQEFTALRRLVRVGRRVVVHTHYADRRTAVHCIRLGALAYVAKSETLDHLVLAIRAAANGERYTPPSLSGSILADDDPSRPALSAREQEVLRAWFVCASKEMAAQMLGISPKTIDTHIQRVRDKYAAVGRRARTKTALAHRAVEDGIIAFADLDDREP